MVGTDVKMRLIFYAFSRNSLESFLFFWLLFQFDIRVDRSKNWHRIKMSFHLEWAGQWLWTLIRVQIMKNFNT